VPPRAANVISTEIEWTRAFLLDFSGVGRRPEFRFRLRRHGAVGSRWRGFARESIILRMRRARAVWWAQIALAALAGGCGSGDEPAGQPQPSAAGMSAEALGLKACTRAPAHMRPARIPSAGGWLEAAVVGRGAAAVVLPNAGADDQCTWLPLARRLARRGVRTVVVQHGEGPPAAEVIAAASWAWRADTQRVALVGAGAGARAVVTAAARHPEFVSAVVSLSAERLQHGQDDLVPTARRLRRPVLWVGSRDDNLTNWGRDTRQLSEATHSAHQLLLVPTGWGVELVTGTPGRRVVPALERFVLGA
jgi:hypothetical protein